MKIVAIVIVALLNIGLQIEATPQLGVYAGAAPNGPDQVVNYTAWLNNQVIYGTEFEADQTWDYIAGQDWWLSPWKQWVNSAPKGLTRYLVLSMPMLPSSGSVSMAAGAAGAYNSTWRTLAQQLVAYNLSNTVLRIGWEFNGDWYRWAPAAGCDVWVKYFNNIVDTMRSVPGNKFTVAWNVAVSYTAYDASQCWPGDNFVDYVGVDIYDVDWGSYSWPGGQIYGEWDSTINYANNVNLEYNGAVWSSNTANSNVFPGSDKSTWTLLANDTTLQTMREHAWTSLYSGHWGLTYWSAFAKSHNKPLAFNEWGVWAQSRGGFDNPYFIQKMYDFIFDASNNVAFHSYFDVYAYDGDHKLNPPTQFPLASQKFYQLFSGGVASPPTPTPTATPTPTPTPTPTSAFTDSISAASYPAQISGNHGSSFTVVCQYAFNKDSVISAALQNTVSWTWYGGNTAQVSAGKSTVSITITLSGASPVDASNTAIVLQGTPSSVYYTVSDPWNHVTSQSITPVNIYFPSTAAQGQSDTYSTVDQAAAMPTMAWLGIGLAIGLVVTALIVIVIVFIRSQKKSKEETA